jgi:hypothetical protein
MEGDDWDTSVVISIGVQSSDVVKPLWRPFQFEFFADSVRIKASAAQSFPGDVGRTPGRPPCPLRLLLVILYRSRRRLVSES